MSCSLASTLWSQCWVKICADGGANRLYDGFISGSGSSANSTTVKNYIPDYITGDLDSLRNEVQQFYRYKDFLVYNPIFIYPIYCIFMLQLI